MASIENLEITKVDGDVLRISHVVSSAIREGVLQVTTVSAEGGAENVYVFPLARLDHTRSYYTEED